MAHQKYSRAQMEDMVSRFEGSTAGRKAFCAEEQINVYTFQYWRDKFNKEKETDTAVFRQIEAPPGSRVQASLYLHCAAEVRLELPSDYPVDCLADLMRRLSC